MRLGWPTPGTTSPTGTATGAGRLLEEVSLRSSAGRPKSPEHALTNSFQLAGFLVGHRNATYSGLLLATAQAQPRFIEGLERQLAAFVADKDLKR